MTIQPRIEDLLRELAPQALGMLVRRHGQFDACEDAVQQSLLAAALQWAAEGVPASPRSRLVTVAARRLVDEFRSESARRRREETDAVLELPAQPQSSDEDDTLTLLFLCCHPSLSVPSQLALALRAVGGLTTAEIANAFLVPEATMAQRISRAKQTIKSTGIRFDLPPEPERADRLRVVLQVLYLIFNEGYTTSSGPALQRTDLTTEAIRLARMLRQLDARRAGVDVDLAHAEAGQVEHGVPRRCLHAASPIARVFRDALLPFILKAAANGQQTRWMFDYHLDWDRPGLAAS